MKPLHRDAKYIEQRLEQAGITRLYHFTDVSNLRTIAKCRGLWSKQKLEEAGLLSDIVTGGNELSLDLDRYWSNWTKVHLYLTPDTPMAYRKRERSHLCYLVIQPTVALWDGVIFCDRNATDNTQQRGEGALGIDLVDFQAVKAEFPFRDDEQFKKKQAEVLVPDEITLANVLEVVFITQASLEEGVRCWGTSTHPPFRVDKSIFHAGFPHVHSATLTSSEVTGDNVNKQHFASCSGFSRACDRHFAVLVYVEVTAGTKARFVCKKAGEEVVWEEECSFESSGSYWHWVNRNLNSFEAGQYEVEYWLDSIMWVKLPFAVL